MNYISDRIKREYDPNRDVPGPDCHPLVTATDMSLLLLIERLNSRLEELESRLEELAGDTVNTEETE